MSIAVVATCLILALLAGPLGCFVVWRRMAYFGDGLAHSALLGVAVSLFIGMSDQLGMVLIAILFAVSLLWLRAQGMLATDTLLGILAHAALSLGILAMALMGLEDVEVHDYLLGNLTRVSAQTLPWMVGACGLAFGLLLRLWPGLVLMTSSEELAQAEGVLVRRYEFMLMLLMGALVAAAVQLVGVLLITSLLIIPASTARLFTKSPEAMAIGGSLIAAAAMLLGLPLAEKMAVPVGPAIVSLCVVLFALVVLGRGVLTRLNPTA
jgi:zinc transport system permease protein